mgnify:FL=1
MDDTFNIISLPSINLETINNVLGKISKNPIANDIYLCVDGFDLKKKLVAIVHLYFDDHNIALNEFLLLKKNLLKEVVNLGISNKETLEDLEDLMVDAEWLLEEEPIDSFDYVYAQIVALAPIVSSKIAFYILKNNIDNIFWVDCRDFIVTDDTYTNSIIDINISKEKWTSIKNKLKNHSILISQLGVGCNIDNNTTLYSPSTSIHNILNNEN